VLVHVEGQGDNDLGKPEDRDPSASIVSEMSIEEGDALIWEVVKEKGKWVLGSRLPPRGATNEEDH